MARQNSFMHFVITVFSLQIYFSHIFSHCLTIWLDKTCTHNFLEPIYVTIRGYEYSSFKTFCKLQAILTMATSAAVIQTIPSYITAFPSLSIMADFYTIFTQLESSDWQNTAIKESSLQHIFLISDRCGTAQPIVYGGRCPGGSQFHKTADWAISKEQDSKEHSCMASALAHASSFLPWGSTLVSINRLWFSIRKPNETLLTRLLWVTVFYHSNSNPEQFLTTSL